MENNDQDDDLWRHSSSPTPAFTGHCDDQFDLGEKSSSKTIIQSNRIFMEGEDHIASNRKTRITSEQPGLTKQYQNASSSTITPIPNDILDNKKSKISRIWISQYIRPRMEWLVDVIYGKCQAILNREKPFVNRFTFIGICVSSTVSLFSGIGANELCNAVGLLYPWYSSIISLRYPHDNIKSRKWLCYWIVYGIYSLLESSLKKFKLISRIPCYHVMKMGFILWCLSSKFSKHKFSKRVGHNVQRLFHCLENRVDLEQKSLKKYMYGTVDSVFNMMSIPVHPKLHDGTGEGKYRTDTHETESTYSESPTNSAHCLMQNFNFYSLPTGNGEDRFLCIRDLKEYVINFSNGDQKKNQNGFRVQDQYIDSSCLENATQLALSGMGQGLSLFGIFDGHMGSITAEYLRAHLPFSLLITPEFQQGNYEDALRVAIRALHCALRDQSDFYAQENLQLFNQASGSTCSIVLITKTTSYFATLGDSPIFYVKQSQQDGQEKETGENSFQSYRSFSHVLKPHTWWTIEDRQRLLNSNYPIIDMDEDESVQFTDTQHEEGWLANKIIRPSFSGIEPAGGVGDTIYDPPVFNTLLDVLDQYKQEQLTTDFAQISEITQVEGVQSLDDALEDDTVWESLYSHLKAFVEKHPGYQRIHKQFQLDPVYDGDIKQMSFLQHYLRLTDDQAKLQRLPSDMELVRRTASTRSLSNRSISFFFMTSDGVISEEEEDMILHWRKVHEIKKGKDPQTFVPELIKYFKNNPDNEEDDQTLILVWF